MNTESISHKIAWKNGRTIPASQAVLPVEDMGIVHGVCVTEMMRTFSGQAYEVDKHLDRLFRSAAQVGIPIQYTSDKIRQHLLDVVKHNQEIIPDWQEQGVIVFATPGINATYTGGTGQNEATLVIHTFDLPAELWVDAVASGQHLAISAVPMVPDICLPVSAKTRSRLVFHLADQQVQREFPGARAILLNNQGYVRETGTSNLFFVRKNQIFTAPVDTVLPGISREIVIKIARSLGLEVIEKDFCVDELFSADEIFTTSTPYCLLGVSQLNGKQVSDVYPGPVTMSLLNSWSERIGQNIHAQLLEMAQHRQDVTDQ
ncbi:MAG: aminotransferase class IV family protein [Planctomycetaceae bacterium]|nr:aminotransferase class IV family protein [Planctomycetaceae bacterium]